MTTAIIVLAAGAGTRMKSRTPKVLHSIAGRSLLSHAVHAAAGLTPDHLVVVVGHERVRVSAAVTDLATALGLHITVAVQEQQAGTGDAVRAGLGALPDTFDGSVIVTAADIPLLDTASLSELHALHTSENAAVTLLTATVDDPFGYGRVLRTQDDQVTAIVEEKDATAEQRAITEVNAGIYAFDADLLRAALAELSPHNAQHELYLTDVVGIARGRHLPVHGHRVPDAQLVAGCNDRVQLSTLGAEMNRRILRAHMLGGATIVDPSSTWIDADVQVGQDVRIEPGVQLHGTTIIANDSVVGPDTTLTNVVVGQGVSIIRSHASDAVIGDNATVGPFTYIRPGTQLGVGGKLGAFVETKNSSIGAGSKVPHLTYVGDATIGVETNIGCSTVFVNYDGVNKARTTVGDHVRIASDTMLIAPVTVGDGAYTGAGTVVKDDVPPGALAVSGGKQRNIEGWVQRRRPGTPAAAAAARAVDNDATPSASGTELPPTGATPEPSAAADPEIGAENSSASQQS